MILVDFDAIKSNATYIKNTICSKKLCAVVKSDAYGHGLVSVANAIFKVVDMFAVSTVQEGLQLLAFGKKVLVLLPGNTCDTTLAISNGLTLTVDSIDTLIRVKNCAKMLGKVASVHIKIDSGMSRLGFDKNHIDELLPQLVNNYICVEGVFSHFACADGDKPFTDRQFATFCQAASRLETSINKQLVKHIANTAATFADARYHLDMVRVGLGLYGYGDDRLVPAKTLLARVVAIKHLEANDCVGYGATFRCDRETKLAILDVGYAAGFSKNFSNKSFVEINGAKCRQIGNVCMGMMMVDVTGIAVSVGDIAVLFGKSTTWNKNVFMYETLCNTR